MRVELRKAVERRERALEEAAASRVDQLVEINVSVKRSVGLNPLTPPPPHPFQNLRSKVEQYEQLCFSVEQVMEHFSSPPAVLEASCHSSPGKVAGHDDRLLSLFVDNVILKAQVAVQQECKWAEPSLLTVTWS